MKNYKKYLAIVLSAALAVSGAAACAKKDAQSESSAQTESAASVDPVDTSELEKLEVPERPENLGEIKLAEYKGVSVEETKMEPITDANVDAWVDYLLNMNPVEVDRAVESGDTVNIDYTGKMDGKEFDGGSAQGYDLVIGSQSFIDGFEDQIIGHNKGETFDINVTFPEDYSAEELKGKDAVFTVTINAIKVPATLDEEFVAKVTTTGSKTVDEYKNEVKTQMQQQADDSMRMQIASDAFNQVIETSEITPSEDAINWQYATMVKQQLEIYPSNYGMTLGEGLAQWGMTLEDFETEMKNSSTEAIKQLLTIHAIAEAENLSVSEDEKKTFIDEICESNGLETGMSEEDFLKQFNVTAADLNDIMLQEKVLDFLSEHAVVTYVEETTAAETEAEAETETGETAPAETESAAE